MAGPQSTISLDAMSGDLGAEVVVRAAAASLEKHLGLDLILVGDQEELSGLVTRVVGNEPRLRIEHATEVVSMTDAPKDAVRRKRVRSWRRPNSY
jgi:glycerol-3-phosphate acyltransferase PlsX